MDPLVAIAEFAPSSPGHPPRHTPGRGLGDVTGARGRGLTHSGPQFCDATDLIGYRLPNAMAPRVPLVLAVAATAALAVPTSADAAYRAFRSPSGKLGCAFYSDTETPRQVRCEWEGSNDRAVTLGETGKAKRIRVTDTVRDPKARKLAYGKTTKFGSLRCTSRTSGITCRSTRSSHGFSVSVEQQRVF
jgi:hypothetical protein